MMSLYSDNKASYYFLDINRHLGGKNVNLDNYDYDDLMLYIDANFKHTLDYLQNFSYNKQIYKSIITYNNFNFLIIGIPLTDRANENYIYNFIISINCYNLLDCYIQEKEFENNKVLLLELFDFDLLLLVCSLFPKYKSLSFLFLKNKSFILIYGVSKYCTENQYNLIKMKLGEFLNVKEISYLFLYHCMEFTQTYCLLLAPYAVEHLVYHIKT